MQEFCTKQEFTNFIMQRAKASFNQYEDVEAMWKIKDDGEEVLAVLVSRVESSIEYFMFYPIDLEKRNFLNAVIAATYLNGKTAQSPHQEGTFVVDFDGGLLGVKKKFYYNVGRLNYGEIADQIEKVTRLYYGYGEAISELLYDGNAEEFIRNVSSNPLVSNVKISIGESKFSKAREAAETCFNVTGVYNSLVMMRIPLVEEDAELFPKSISATLRFERNRASIDIFHQIPYGFELKRGSNMAMATAYVNNYIEHGKFNADIYTGKATYRLSIDVERSMLEEVDFENIFSSVIQNLKFYYPLYVRYIKGGISTKDFIRWLEEE